ncbi:MAG: hypothetical protein IJG81_05305 [Muribaculaceae bacterium]|nr:hypothetical protein [Muribaculaceae bacterium]
MAGYIIGLVIGLLIFLLQNFKPTSNSFRVLSLILTIAFIWGISYANLSYWNIAVIPFGVIFYALFQHLFSHMELMLLKLNMRLLMVKITL